MPYIQDCIAAGHPARGTKKNLPVWLTALLAVFVFLLLGSALAADDTMSSETNGTKSSAKKGKSSAKSKAQSDSYKEERAACMSSTTQDRKACLREIGAARYEAKRGGLTDPEAELQQNALKRCELVPQSDRSACERRVRGDRVSGSVEGGGILRETTTTVPAPQPESTGQPRTPRAMPSTMPPGSTAPGSAPSSGAVR